MLPSFCLECKFDRKPNSNMFSPLIWTPILHLLEPTRILKQPEYKVVQRGMSAAFECKVKHDPSLIPTMTWLKDNGELPDDERYNDRKTNKRLIEPF